MSLKSGLLNLFKTCQQNEIINCGLPIIAQKALDLNMPQLSKQQFTCQKNNAELIVCNLMEMPNTPGIS